MNQKELQNRTKKFAIEVIKLMDELPNKQVDWTITNQLVRSSTSVAANYRTVGRAKSDKDFIAKMGIVLEEADESLFWLELIEELKLVKSIDELQRLKGEANELVSIFVATQKTIKARLNRKF